MLDKKIKFFFIFEGIITLFLALDIILLSPSQGILKIFAKFNFLPWIVIGKLILVIVNIYILFNAYFRAKEKLIFPIQKITKILQNFALGNFERTIHYSWPNEVGDLSNAVNRIGKRFRQLTEEYSFLKENFYQLLDCIEEGVLFLYGNTKIFFLNKKATELLGMPLEKITGKSLLSVIRNYEIIKETEEALMDGKIRELNLSYFIKEGTYKVLIIPVKENLKIINCVILIKDLTYVKNMEKIKTELIANISHELKTPITSIKGFIETLLDGAFKDEEITLRFLNIIDFEIGRLYRLIVDLINLSEIESGHLKIKKEKLKLEEVFEEINLIFKKRFEEKNLEFSYKNSISELISDRDKLMQILINLVDNAVKYTPEGGKIWIESEGQNGEVTIKICDTGIGIPEEHLGRIFERFYRVDKARSRESGGSGLGLAIVKHLAGALGAEIKVESRLNQGTKFIITFKS